MVGIECESLENMTAPFLVPNCAMSALSFIAGTDVDLFISCWEGPRDIEGDLMLRGKLRGPRPLRYYFYPRQTHYPWCPKNSQVIEDTRNHWATNAGCPG